MRREPTLIKLIKCVKSWEPAEKTAGYKGVVLNRSLDLLLRKPLDTEKGGIHAAQEGNSGYKCNV